MSHLEILPLWAAVLIAAFLLIGSVLTLLGTIGLVYLKSFYDRLHAPTLGTSWGTAGIILASMLLFTVTGDRSILHEFLIGAFVMITTPVTLLLLGLAALHRDRVERSETLTEVAQSDD
jgi:multicomponent K+:H+ antiporter subunit G